MNQLTPQNRNRRGPKAITVVLLLSISIFGCEIDLGGAKSGSKGTGTEVVVKKDIIVPVEAYPPTRGKISAYYETWTRVEAERKVDVASESEGVCETVLVEAGDVVKQGDVLAHLEQEEAEASLQQAKIQVLQNKTAYELAVKQHDQGVGTKLDMDNAMFAFQQSESTVKVQRIQLANKTIRAPIAGTVTSRQIQKGMLISKNMHTFSIVDPSSFMLAIDPPEKELPRLHVGQVATVTIDALQGEEFETRIRRINPSVDSESGTVRAILDFEEEDRLRLRDSAFARVKLVMDTFDDALLVPKEAIVEENTRRYLFVVQPVEPEPSEDDESDTPEDGESETPEEPKFVAQRVEVLTGLEDSRFIQILGRLSEKDLVVVNGQNTLKDGAFVHVTTTADAITKRADMTAAEALRAAKEDSAATDPSSRVDSKRVH